MLERDKPFNFKSSVLHPNAIVVIIKAIDILGFGNFSINVIYEEGKSFDAVATPRMLAFVYTLLHEFFKSDGSAVFIGAHGMSCILFNAVFNLI